MNDVLGAVITFTAGVGITALNYLVSKYVLQKSPDKFAMTSVIKQIVNVSFLVAVYMLSDYLPWNFTYLIVGAVLGITLPMIVFTRKLVKLNEARCDAPKCKEGEKNG